MEIGRNSDEKIEILSGEGDRSHSHSRDQDPDIENQHDYLITSKKKNSFSSFLS
jgi:hypothetical protein